MCRGMAGEELVMVFLWALGSGKPRKIYEG
jgi:hypothetical protein